MHSVCIINANTTMFFLFTADICDGSKGLLKFISIAHSDPEGKMIASLEPHLCPTATTFSRSHRKQFISWTCSQVR